jgi:hypothetical protein
VRLKTRENVLLEKVFEMDGWLDDPANRADQPPWRQVLRRRDQAVKLLRSNRKLIETRKEQTP